MAVFSSIYIYTYIWSMIVPSVKTHDSSLLFVRNQSIETFFVEF